MGPELKRDAAMAGFCLWLAGAVAWYLTHP